MDRCINILIVDFDDSYTYNIPSFIKNSDADSQQYKIDIKRFTCLYKCHVENVCKCYDGIVLSAGPGTVDRVEDIGEFVPTLLSHPSAAPVFGICLGFQAICKSFGGSVDMLRVPHHGIISEMLHPVSLHPLGRRATRYHSLEVILNDQARTNLEVLAVALNFPKGQGHSIMEVKHHHLPFWGVQYHPESMYSHGCSQIMRGFLDAALRRSLNAVAKRTVYPEGLNTVKGHLNGLNATIIQPSGSTQELLWKKIDIDGNFTDLVRLLLHQSTDFVLLDSAGKDEWSIATDSSSSFSFRYSLRSRHLSFRATNSKNRTTSPFSRNCSLDEVWDWLKEYTQSHKCTNGPSEAPFWGGFVGFFSYELGLAELGLRAYSEQGKYTKAKDVNVPQFDDIHLLWSNETLLFHESTNSLYLISLNKDLAWIEGVQTRIRESNPSQSTIIAPFPRSQPAKQESSKSKYLEKIEQAQREIKKGNSYELCLTAPTLMACPSSDYVEHHANLRDKTRIDQEVAWHLYKLLRSQNPAPYMSLLHLGGIDFLSASPELFLRFNAGTGIAQMKPIKGTVSKFDNEGGRRSLREARIALSDTKIIAENLMIVDLIRNDLSKMSDAVYCPELMHVEETASLYQLVSTVEAKVREGVTAWDLLKSSLPPGSMTGAPKKRSCEILQSLEGRCSRGLYSGVVGYIDVQGNCQTSVSIRNATKYTDEEFWRIGAGGAVTTLSDPEEEWREREMKTCAVLEVFEPNFEILETMLWNPNTDKIVHQEEHFQRLYDSIRYFRFSPKLHTHEGGVKRGISPMGQVARSATNKELIDWIEKQIDLDSSCFLRLRLTVSAKGHIGLKHSRINDPSFPVPPVRVYVDPFATDVYTLSAFVVNKTTFRASYDAARQRVSADGRDEVLLFRSAVDSGRGVKSLHRVSPQPGKDDDILTEGSYTNVAVCIEGKWYTPSDWCLPGIERKVMLESGAFTVRDITRRTLRAGMEVKLCNSVRGVFDGIVFI